MSSTTQPSKTPYNGENRKLVVAIDVGTTFTAASFCILQPQEIPQFVEIVQWPTQATADAKVPSVVMYDDIGKARAFGAASDDDATLLDAEDEWTRCEWFKLHFRPSHLPTIQGLQLPPLPFGKTVDDVLTDFLGYVKKHIQDYITTRYAEGGCIWSSLSPHMDVVLTTPNGWELEQQQRMRAAAEKAGLIAGERSGQHIRFVTEAEAAILYAIDTGNVVEWMKLNSQLVLCDCGGGTIDITSYKIISANPLCLEETTIAKCYLAGAVFITDACKRYLQEHLKGTEWSEAEAIRQASEHFDKNAKRKFEQLEQTSLVDLGGFKGDHKLGIVRGKLKIPGVKMAEFYDSSLAKIQAGLAAVMTESHQEAKNVILVGGLASSPYIYRQLQKWATEKGMNITRPDGPTTKAVANGALAWYLDNSIAARISKYHYGVTVLRDYSPSDPSLSGRGIHMHPSGERKVYGGWSTVVSRGTRVHEGEEYHRSFRRHRLLATTISRFRTTVYACRSQITPQFVVDSSGDPTPGCEELCVIEADVTAAWNMAPILTGALGEYQKISFDVCLTFGSTELSARIRWQEDDAHCYGPATIAYIPRAPETSS